MKGNDVFDIEGGIVNKRPVEEVFDFAADVRNEPRYNPHMRRAEQITDGPIGVGTRSRAEISSMRRTVPMVTEITAHERPRSMPMGKASNECPKS